MLYQPTCVGLRYGPWSSWLEAFLGSSGSIRAAWGEPRAFPSPLSHRSNGFAYRSSLPVWRVLPPRDLPPCVPPSLITAPSGTGILTRCPSPTPSGLGLGPPHPQLISMAAEPSGIRWGGFTPPSRYSCRHSHSPALQQAFQPTFSAAGDAPLPCAMNHASAASAPDLAPVDCRCRGTIDQ